jgi:hypothetical protein
MIKVILCHCALTPARRISNYRETAELTSQAN